MNQAEALYAMKDILSQVAVALEQEGIKLDTLDVEAYEKDETGAEVILKVKTPSTYTHQYVLDLRELIPSAFLHAKNQGEVKTQ